MTALPDSELTDILPRVQKPSRYLGREVNAVRKDPGEVDVRIAFAFPDLYDLGLPNLGLMILYNILNRQPGVWAERVYHPAIDMENELRRRGLPLFALESRSPLGEFDAIGFTLQHELSYTNILNMLDLSGIPLLSADRGDAHPLILAGGLAQGIRETKGLPREQRLRRLAQIDGAFVPCLFGTKTLPDGMVATDAAPRTIQKRVIEDLDKAPFPTSYIVPFTEQVHDRISLEVFRGCTHGCRFCQAGMIARPVRERSIETLDRLMCDVLARTGYEQVALASLSTCDYSRIRTLVARATERAAPQMVSVSLPSLRLDTFAVELAEMLETVRRTGLTFAPEAATPRLRKVINKWLTDEDLFEVIQAVFSRGWDRVKLYFMIGLPTEQEEDVRRIAHLVNEVVRRGRRVNQRAHVSTGIATFVPKPHTPFQWERQISIAETLEKQRLLASLLKSRVKFGRHDAQMSVIEGVISRGDRRIGKVLLEAHRLGCKMDSWREHFEFDNWRRAFDASGVDPDEYLRERDPEIPLPWDVIDPMVEHGHLLLERERALAGELTPDCREGQCNQCGVMLRLMDPCINLLGMPRRREEDAAAEGLQVPKQPERKPRQRMRFRFARRGEMRFLSHHETVNAIARALRRARIPVAFSHGFHPQMKLALGTALPVGVASEGEYADVLLTDILSSRQFAERLNAELPEGISVLAAWEAPLKAASLAAGIVAQAYEITIPNAISGGPAKVQTRIDRIVKSDSLTVERPSKKRVRRVDIRPLIQQLQLAEAGTDETRVHLFLKDHNGVKGRPQEVVEALIGDHAAGWFLTKVRKLDSFVRRRGRLASVAEEAVQSSRGGKEGGANEDHVEVLRG